VNQRLIVIARYWNDIEWVEASLKHIEMWDPQAVVLSEGNWDQQWSPRSTDGTRNILEDWASGKDHVQVIDNVRADKNYRVNQANTSNLAMTLVDADVGDWVLVVDCDHFYHEKDIKAVRELMEKEKDVDYFTMPTLGFLVDLSTCQYTVDKVGTKIPYRLKPRFNWRPTNHLSIRVDWYCNRHDTKAMHLPWCNAYHYERMRLPKRHEDKYNIGDRKTPKQAGRESKLEPCRHNDHPALAVPVLKEMGYL